MSFQDKRFKSNFRLCLSGTPLQNNVKEFWALLNFMAPVKYADSEDFVEEFGDMEKQSEVKALQSVIRPFMLRRLKEDVEKSVPPKKEQVSKQREPNLVTHS